MKYLIAIVLTLFTVLAQAQEACGSAGEQSQGNIIAKYSRFTDSQTKKVVQSASQISLAQNVRDMIGRGGGVSGAVAGVSGEVENNKRQVERSADTFCKLSSGCSSVSSLGWPERLPDTFTASNGLQRVYAMTSLMLELNSLTLKALQQCPGR